MMLCQILIDETTNITVYQRMGIMVRFFDNVIGEVRTVIFPLTQTNAESLFKLIDANFSASSPVNYSNLIGVGSDGTNVMFGCRNSVLSRLKQKQPSLVAYHCNCHIAALIANHALPDS